MDGVRILAGGPTRGDESELFRLHELSLLQQIGPSLELDVRHKEVPDIGGPRWHDQKILNVAKVRQHFCGLAVNGGYDYLFLVDDDIVLAPHVLATLLEVPADIVYGVFWTQSNWGGFPRPWPQVWDRHPYGFSPELWHALNDPDRHVHYVLGGGACTLINTKYLAPMRDQYYPLIESIRYSGGMWGGEDRSFNLRAEVRKVPQMAVTGLPISHVHGQYTPEILQGVADFCGISGYRAAGLEPAPDPGSGVPHPGGFPAVLPGPDDLA